MQIERAGSVPNLEWGNTEAVDTGGRHWIVGHSDVLKAMPLRFMPNGAKASAIAIKWRAHPENDPESGKEKPLSVGRTISILTNEGRFRLRFWTDNPADATALLLDKPGDFVVWREGLNHAWEVPAASTIVTIRWTPETAEEWPRPERLKARYEFVTAQLRYINETILDAFKDWVKLFTLIVGGYLWLRIQKPALPVELPHLPAFGRTLIGLIGLSYALMICMGGRSWFGYREAEFNLMPDARAPRCCRSVCQEILMVAVIVLITGLAWWLIE